VIIDGSSHNKWDEERFGSMLIHSMDEIVEIVEIVDMDSIFELNKVF
jgi:hypothetical protein